MPFASDGHVDTTLTLQSMVLLPGGHHDCRTGDCEVRASASNEASETGRAPLLFDPAGPAPPEPSVEVHPTTDLTDGERVTITGSALLPEDEVFMAQCVASTDTCGIVTDAAAVVRGDGTFVVALRTRTVLETRNAHIDCRVTACVIAFFATFGLDRVEVPVTFDPEAPLLEPRIVVRPRRDLTPTRTIRVHGGGFVPFEGFIGVALCIGLPGPNGQGQSARCDRRLAAATAPAPPSPSSSPSVASSGCPPTARSTAGSGSAACGPPSTTAAMPSPASASCSGPRTDLRRPLGGDAERVSCRPIVRPTSGGSSGQA